MLPPRGMVLPCGSVKLRVEFNPSTVAQHTLHLAMDILGVASPAAVLPVTGECAPPRLTLEPGTDVLKFGEVYLHHASIAAFKLRNDSLLPARFEVQAPVRCLLCALWLCFVRQARPGVLARHSTPG